MIEFIGLIGGLAFSLSGIPTAIKTYKDGQTQIPASTCWLVIIGTLLTFIYFCMKHGFDWPITLNYVSSISIWAFILRYVHFPVKRLMEHEDYKIKEIV